MIRTALLLIVSLLAGCAAPRADVRSAPSKAEDVPLGALPRQALEKGQCGLFLWRVGAEARLVLAVRSGPPPLARMMLDGRLLDLPRLPDSGPAFDSSARYGDGQVTLALDLVIERREGLSDGAVAGGSIRIDRSGAESFALPVSGLLACD